MSLIVRETEVAILRCTMNLWFWSLFSSSSPANRVVYFISPSAGDYTFFVFASEFCVVIIRKSRRSRSSQDRRWYSSHHLHLMLCYFLHAIYFLLSSTTTKFLFTPRFSKASTTAPLCGPWTITSIIGVLTPTTGLTEALVAQLFLNSSANSPGLTKNASSPQVRVTVFRPCLFSRTTLILGGLPFLSG